MRIRIFKISGTIAVAALVAVGCRTTRPGGTASGLRDDATGTGGYTGPYRAEQVDEAALWSKYCKGEYANVAAPILPNYDDEDVKQAARNLSLINPHSYSLYGQINRLYRNGAVPPTLQLGDATSVTVTAPAQEFLIYLCGEFRDRATLVREKINWVRNMNYMAPVDQPAIDLQRAKSESIWLQVTARSYRPYLQFSLAYYNSKKALVAAEKLTLGTHTGIDRPTSPVTVCETKFIFAEYIAKKITFPGLPAFQAAYDAWSTSEAGNCVEGDKDYVYDFRGDGNFKPNSPEGNGMIWHAISSALQCANRGKSRKESTPQTFAVPGQSLVFSDADCQGYFGAPFASRWNGARAGLGAWMLRDKAHDDIAHDSRNNVTVNPAWGKNFRTSPHNFTVQGQPGQLAGGWETAYTEAGMSLDRIAGVEDPEARKGFIYERLRDAVDRHTDWYASSYDDLMAQKRERPDAYSPFVASSYEMSASDAFTAPCYTIPCTGEVPARNWKQFMFVFKIKKSNWYTTDSIKAGELPDFDRNWFDETSLGTVPLAKNERAFDRLGTALEGEYDSILYLHNICSNGQIEKLDTGGRLCDGTTPAAAAPVTP